MSTYVVQSQSDCPSQPEHFRERLKQELAARCGRNPRYSLRAFANYLAVDHATLSQILRGKRAVTEATVRKFGPRIGLDAAQIDRYVAATNEAPDVGARVHRALAADAARVVSGGHAFAILELMRLAEFRPDIGWIERMLDVPAADIQVALQHLLRLGFLAMPSADRWIDLTGGAIVYEEEFTIRSLERLIEKSHARQSASARAAADQPRFHGGATIAVREDEIDLLMRLSRNLLRNVRTGIGNGNGERAAERLYQLDVHCYPLASTPPSAPPPATPASADVAPAYRTDSPPAIPPTEET